MVYEVIIMKIMESQENYLETILILKKQLGEVRSIDVANHLSYSKPSVSTAMKQLRENGFICVNGSGYISLTKKGLDVANSIYERHSLLTEFLIALGVCEETAKEDACKIEHHISEESFQKMKEHCLLNIRSRNCCKKE